jgi:hypothetical protein
MDMHTKDLVGINGITRILLVYTCQQDVYPRGHVLPLQLPDILHIYSNLHVFYETKQCRGEGKIKGEDRGNECTVNL